MLTHPGQRSRGEPSSASQCQRIRAICNPGDA